MNARPFLFDVTFDDPDPKIADVAAAAAPEPEPQFSEAELEEAKAAAYADGLAAGRAQSEAEADHTTRQILDVITQGLSSACAAAEHALAETLSIAPIMTMAALKKAFPQLVANHGHDEIINVIRNAMNHASDEPRIVVRLSDDNYDAVEPLLAPLAARTGFAGRMVALADGKVALGDVMVEWADGGQFRDLNRLTRAIADALETMPGPPDPASQDAAPPSTPADVTAKELESNV